MKASRVFAFLAVLALVGGLALAAEDQTTATPGDRGTGLASKINLEKSHDLIGREIKSSSGDKLGKVDDLVVGPDHKRVDYVIASSGGLAGIGTKYYAIPWRAFQMKPGQKDLTLNIAKDKFQSAPTFEKKNLSTLMQERDRLNSFYGTSSTGGMSEDMETPSGSGYKGSSDTETPSGSATPSGGSSATPSNTGTPSGGSSATPSDTGTPSGSGYSGSMDESAGASAETGSERQMARVSDITGTNVKNSKGENLGEIENLMIETNTGRIMFAVIGYGGVVGMGEKYVAVPWRAVQWDPSQSVAMVNADKSTFDSLAFTSDKWPDLASREYMQKIQGKFGNAPTGQVYGFVAPTGEQRTKGWAQDSMYNKMFKPDSMTKIEGTIESVGTFRPAPGAEPGTRLRVKTSDGQTMIVQAGPTAFAQEKGFSFNQGDKVTVNGSKVQMLGRDVLMASTIESNGKTLTLRDDKGNVQWKTEDLIKGREMNKSTTPDKSTGTPSGGTVEPSGSSDTGTGGSTGGG